MRQLLEKLEVHAPGSGVIRAYCRCLRGNELRGIITTMLEDEDLSEPQVAENIEVDPKQEDESPGEEQVLATPVNNDTASEIPHEEIPAPSSVASRLFGESSSLAHTENNNSSHAMAEESSGEKQANDFSSGDTDLDFLESSETVFDGDKAQDADETMESHSANDDTNSSLDHGSIPESVLLASTTDITMDIQMNEDTTSNQNADENPWTDDTTEATGGVEEAAIVTESEELNTHDAEESVEQFDTEGHDTENVGEVEEEAREGPVEATTAQNEDYDWLANSTELDAETAEADSFEHEMATVSEDEADVAHQEQAEPPQDYNWSTAEATEPTIEEGAETSEEAQNDVDGEAYENEEAYENGVVEDNGDYSVDGEVAAEDTEDTDAQYELGGAWMQTTRRQKRLVTGRRASIRIPTTTFGSTTAPARARGRHQRGGRTKLMSLSVQRMKMLLKGLKLEKSSKTKSMMNRAQRLRSMKRAVLKSKSMLKEPLKENTTRRKLVASSIMRPMRKDNATKRALRKANTMKWGRMMKAKRKVNTTKKVRSNMRARSTKRAQQMTSTTKRARWKSSSMKRTLPMVNGTTRPLLKARTTRLKTRTMRSPRTRGTQ